MSTDTDIIASIDLTIDITADDSDSDLLELQASTTDERPFAIWMSPEKKWTKLHMSADALIAVDRSLPAFATISFAPRA